ncbi:MAG TPA: Crp/Fnr family transcriptional regulator, partial [Puia sp.]|nr:Crp/Fnr family transcriptional regulator [Puia sp.]
MTSFFTFIKKFTTLSEESQAALSSVLQPMELPRGHNLLRPGAICQYLYFIEKGLTRTYYLKNGKDVTDWFSAEDSIAVSIISFLTHQPDRRGIELLEDSVLWTISYSDLERLYREYHDIERLGRLLVSHGIIQLQQRFDDLHFSTARYRYQQLI